MNQPPAGAASKRNDDKAIEAAEEVAPVAEGPEPPETQEVARAGHQRNEVYREALEMGIAKRNS